MGNKMNLNKITNKDSFKIYFFPIVVYYILVLVLYLLFHPFEPDSIKEKYFLILGNIITLSFLWYLAYRYKKIKSRPVGKRVIILLTILTVLMLLGLVIGLYDIIRYLLVV